MSGDSAKVPIECVICCAPCRVGAVNLCATCQRAWDRWNRSADAQWHIGAIVEWVAKRTRRIERARAKRARNAGDA